MSVFLMIYLISSSFTGSVQVLPLILFAITIFLPPLLVLITTRKPIYAAWMGAYIAAIPIWYCALPLYAFWHFDGLFRIDPDFSWGDTRKVVGETKGDHSERAGRYEIGSVQMKKFS